MQILNINTEILYIVEGDCFFYLVVLHPISGGLKMHQNKIKYSKLHKNAKYKNVTSCNSNHVEKLNESIYTQETIILNKIS